MPENKVEHMSLLDKRANGVLMHISSLPGKTGIGTLGSSAYAFVDFLKNSSQTYWQILPIGPTSFGDSPYQSFSTFAGNPYFIDLEFLEHDGLISKEDWENVNWGNDSTFVDYGVLYKERHALFAKVQKNFEKNIPSEYYDFCNYNSAWLEDYSLFMAIKDAHGGCSFDCWEDDIRKREGDAVKFWYEKCLNRVSYYKMLQFLFYKQWYALKKYANERGIKIIGDIPIYVAADSADVWSNPKQFYLDADSRPIEVAGCPPDGFSANGQLWGNPVYNWDYMKNNGYSWWKKRLDMSLKNYDVLRIDHFRGFDSYYCIPFGSSDAKNGFWRQGPGADLFSEIKKTFGELPIIAEDLGFLTDSVYKMLDEVGFPGMKVLQFAFDSRETNSGYLPHCYKKNSVVYTGTHDNDTIRGWMSAISKDDLEFAKAYLRADENNLAVNMMLTAMATVSNTCVLTMQDLIGLDGRARMNQPSTVGKNWKWRATQDQLSESVGEFLRRNTVLYRRCR